MFFIKLPAEYYFSFPNQFDSRFVETASVFGKIATLQKDIAEICCDKEHAIRNRMIGIFDGYQIRIVYTFEEVKDSPHAVKILFTDSTPSNDQVDAQTIVVLINGPSTATTKSLNLDGLTPSLLKQRALEIVSMLGERQREEFEDLKSHVGFEQNYSQLKTATNVNDGFYNRINIAVLESMRLTVNKSGTSSDFHREDAIALVNRMVHVRSNIANALGMAGIAPAVQMYFSDTSSSLEFYRNKKNYTQASLKSRGVSDWKELIEAIKCSDRGLVSGINSSNRFIAALEKERHLLDTLIVLSAANNAAPVVKLPLSNNKAFSQVANLASSDRSSGRKSNALMKQVREAFSQYVDEWLEYADDVPSLAIKLVSNFPLEWTYHQGLPLMVRHEVSRIPVTPGYVTSKLLLNSDVVHLPLHSFREILFISSFADDDPIRNHLKDKLDVIQHDLSTREQGLSSVVEQLKKSGEIPVSYRIPEEINQLDIRFNWIEVSTGEELVNAINSNPCAITIFDLHGSHSTEGGGLLHLKSETISVFDISKDIRISPIVILSSCDTSPVDKGHDSTAEAFFLAGAKTLISSALPILSDQASTFLVRLLERIRTYLPVSLEQGRSIRWSTLVSGMIRRVYYYELISLLQTSLRFESKLKSNLLFRIGMIIDPLQPDWVDAVNTEITSSLGISIDYLNDFVAKNAQFLECMKYFQLGRPELIVLSANPSD